MIDTLQAVRNAIFKDCVAAMDAEILASIRDAVDYNMCHTIPYVYKPGDVLRTLDDIRSTPQNSWPALSLPFHELPSGLAVSGPAYKVQFDELLEDESATSAAAHQGQHMLEFLAYETLTDPAHAANSDKVAFPDEPTFTRDSAYWHFAENFWGPSPLLKVIGILHDQENLFDSKWSFLAEEVLAANVVKRKPAWDAPVAVIEEGGELTYLLDPSPVTLTRHPRVLVL